MSESVQAWWRRRCRVTGTSAPYEVGRYREAWARYPVLQRQYHPELNGGIALSQIPPVAEVLVLWQCEVGHLFAATPAEQRGRPVRQRRRSAWCPECTADATPRIPRPAHTPPTLPAPSRKAGGRGLCVRTPELPAGEAFTSECAPSTASATEAQLRHGLGERLMFDGSVNAVRLGRPFFHHLEAWPDIVLPELRVAIEYDTVGRHGLEHVGPREASDRRKDRALRAAKWEVIRIRTGPLIPLGPFDVTASAVTRSMFPKLLDALRAARGALIVDAYLR